MPPPMTSRRCGRSKLERAGRIDDARIVRQIRQADRFGAGGDDAVLEGDALAPRRRPLTSISCGETNLPVPRITSTLRCFASIARPPVSLPTILFFQSRSLAASICGLPKCTPCAAHRFRFLDDLRGVQQRLRRNAADVEADAAELRPALDQRDFQAEIGGAERGGVAAGAGAEHDDFEIVGR